MTYCCTKNGEITGTNVIFLHLVADAKKVLEIELLVQSIKNGYIMGIHKTFIWKENSELVWENVSLFTKKKSNM